MHASGSGCFGREDSSFGIKSTEMGETGRTVNVTWVMISVKKCVIFTRKWQLALSCVFKGGAVLVNVIIIYTGFE